MPSTSPLTCETRVRHLRAACLLAAVASRLPAPRSLRLAAATRAIGLISVEYRIGGGSWRTIRAARSAA